MDGHYKTSPPLHSERPKFFHERCPAPSPLILPHHLCLARPYLPTNRFLLQCRNRSTYHLPISARPNRLQLPNGQEKQGGVCKRSALRPAEFPTYGFHEQSGRFLYLRQKDE